MRFKIEYRFSITIQHAKFIIDGKSVYTNFETNFRIIFSLYRKKRNIISYFFIINKNTCKFVTFKKENDFMRVLDSSEFIFKTDV